MKMPCVEFLRNVSALDDQGDGLRLTSRSRAFAHRSNPPILKWSHFKMLPTSPASISNNWEGSARARHLS